MLVFRSPAWRSGCHQNHTGGSLTPWRENYIEAAAAVKTTVSTYSLMLSIRVCKSTSTKGMRREKMR